MRIYITHCSAKKDKSLENSARKVTPDKLYIATPTKRFINKCKEKKVYWAIFSDMYGVWFPKIKHKWYDKNPGKVINQEFKNLIKNFNKNLQKYSEIWFYYNPGRFHPLYKKLIQETILKNKVKLFTHLNEIG